MSTPVRRDDRGKIVGITKDGKPIAAGETYLHRQDERNATIWLQGRLSWVWNEPMGCWATIADAACPACGKSPLHIASSRHIVELDRWHFSIPPHGDCAPRAISAVGLAQLIRRAE